MFRSIWTASVHTRSFLRRYMPTNIALDAIRSRRGLRWGIPAMLVALPYLYAASVVTTLIAVGKSRWNVNVFSVFADCVLDWAIRHDDDRLVLEIPMRCPGGEVYEALGNPGASSVMRSAKA